MFTCALLLNPCRSRGIQGQLLISVRLNTGQGVAGDHSKIHIVFLATPSPVSFGLLGFSNPNIVASVNFLPHLRRPAYLALWWRNKCDGHMKICVCVCVFVCVCVCVCVFVCV